MMLKFFFGGLKAQLDRLRGGGNQLWFIMLCGLALIAIVHVEISFLVSKRMVSAKERYEQSRQLNLQYMLISRSSSLAPAMIAELLFQDVSRDPTLAGIEMISEGCDGVATRTRFRGRAEPLLRWLGLLSTRGIFYEPIQISLSAQDQLDICVTWGEQKIPCVDGCSG
ncbi:hypothetical protein PflCFBP13517_25710 [Pseudomonas fluorescens]|nr:hypothetical protein PflCFBP13517_25710 [Pseudomonas fluorescens]